MMSQTDFKGPANAGGDTGVSVIPQQRLLEIDEKGLKKYLDLVIREVKKVDKNKNDN